MAPGGDFKYGILQKMRNRLHGFLRPDLPIFMLRKQKTARNPARRSVMDEVPAIM